MNKSSLIFLFEFLLFIVFLFFYMAIWTSESWICSTVSAKFFNTGFVCAFHMIFGIGGACIINVYKNE